MIDAPQVNRNSGRCVRRREPSFTQTLAEASIASGFKRHVNCERGVLRVREDLYDLHSFSHVLVISLGKAGHTMVEALSAQVGASLEGIVASSVAPASQVRGFRYFRGGHPTPNAESIQAATAMLRAARSPASLRTGHLSHQRRRILDCRKAD